MADDNAYLRGNPSYPPSYRTSPSRYDDAPRPYLPSHSPSFTSLGPASPISYDDRDKAYSPYQDLTPTPYSEDSSGAVPLRPYLNKRESTGSQAPMVVQTDDDDPFVRDAKPGAKPRLFEDDILLQDQGWFKGKITWVCFVFSIVQIGVFIAELVRMAILTGSPIETKPSFNYMIGPSPYVLINVGARYQPCMHYMSLVNDTISWPCPNTTSTTDAAVCTLSELCGFGGVDIPADYGTTDEPYPNQWFRFIVPIFIHAGFIHIGFNLLLQLTLGRDMERAIGSARFLLVYLSAGIFGFVLGGNFAADGIASTGASGSLFGVLALNLLDLLYGWKQRRSPKKDLAFIAVDVVIAFVLGLLPGLDNFSHIGGFLTGLVLGVCILRTPPVIANRLGEARRAYPAVGAGPRAWAGRAASTFRERKPLWWAWWLVRAVMLIGAVVGFIVLLKNFYVWHRTCGWCKYLSCLDVSDWCELGDLDFTSSSSSSSAKRAAEMFARGMSPAVY